MQCVINLIVSQIVCILKLWILLKVENNVDKVNQLLCSYTKSLHFVNLGGGDVNKIGKLGFLGCEMEGGFKFLGKERCFSAGWNFLKYLPIKHAHPEGIRYSDAEPFCRCDRTVRSRMWMRMWGKRWVSNACCNFHTYPNHKIKMSNIWRNLFAPPFPPSGLQLSWLKV